MQINDQARYRIRLAEGFLGEARQDMTLRRWRSCVDNSQLAVENAAKATLALLGPVGRTHNPATLLRRALADNRFPQETRMNVEQIAECAELLGQDIHVGSDYGDETGWQTPWELFDESDARQALNSAESAVTLAKELVDTDEHR
jgi:HEPN domain-containing protein